MTDTDSEINDRDGTEYRLRLLDPSAPEAEELMGSSDDPIILPDGENAKDVLVLDPIIVTPDDAEGGSSEDVGSPEDAIAIVRGAVDTWMSGMRDLIERSDNHFDLGDESQRAAQLKAFDRLHGLIVGSRLFVYMFTK